MAFKAPVQHVRGHDFQGNPVEELKTSPDQLSLFQDAFSPGTSNTIELYDAMPKIFASPKEMAARRKKNGGQFLDTLTRSFKHRQVEYVLTIRPARLPTKNGDEREFYPTKREDLIEQTLRQMATNPTNGIYLGGDLAVQFSMSDLRRELERTGHGMTYENVMQGLQVNNRTTTSLATKEGDNVISSTIFPTLMHASREQWEKNPVDTKCYVKFHPLVTLSVEEFTNRHMNYDAQMRLKRTLSHYLYRRISHLYRQADFHKPYSIRLSTLVYDSKLLNSTYPSDNLKQVRLTLQEFQDTGAILGWDEEITRGANNRIADVKFVLCPSPQLKEDAINANHQQQRLRQLGNEIGISKPN